MGFDLLPAESHAPATIDSGLPGNDDAAAGGASGAPENGGTDGSGGTPTSANGGTAGSAATTSESGGGFVGAGGTASGGATSVDASAPDSASGGARASGGAAGHGGASEAGPATSCASGGAALEVWSFDSTVEGWAFWPNLGTGTLSWTSTNGNPSAGALALDVQTGSGLLGWIVLDAPAPDLSGQTGSVWVWLDSAATLDVKLYVQSNPQYSWADGGGVTLAPKTWTCLTIDFGNPVYAHMKYDPSMVVRYGIELAGNGPLTLYVDQFSY
jgi:hypothetical protein